MSSRILIRYIEGKHCCQWGKHATRVSLCLARLGCMNVCQRPPWGVGQAKVSVLNPCCPVAKAKAKRGTAQVWDTRTNRFDCNVCDADQCEDNLGALLTWPSLPSLPCPCWQLLLLGDVLFSTPPHHQYEPRLLSATLISVMYLHRLSMYYVCNCVL